MSFTFPVLSHRVVDGDTIRCVVDLGFMVSYGPEVRLAGLDTPERNTAEGRIVTAYVEWWLSLGGVTLVSKELDREKFGRVLGDFQTSAHHITLCTVLLQSGLARPYTGERKVPWTVEQLARIHDYIKDLPLVIAPAPVKRPRKRT